jgi:5-methyltetrahydropteroyltriglutamate--homocysteine methyltransferase
VAEPNDDGVAVRASNLGFPRMGPGRELKNALEGYWAGRMSAEDLTATASMLRRANWHFQHQLGIDHIPSNDFSLYDHVLDAAVMLGAIPERYRGSDGGIDLDSYFAMARGGQLAGRSVAALEMTKWFDTNYHYLVPELQPGQPFEANPGKILDELREAAAMGISTRPVLLGPVSFLVLAKQRQHPGDHLALLPGLLEAYEEILSALADGGASWVQIDEPVLGVDLPVEVVDAYPDVYARLAGVAPSLRLLIATYFTGLRRNLPVALALPVAAVHLDLVAAPDQLELAIDTAPDTLALSLGVVDGRNVWRSDLEPTLQILDGARRRLGAHRLIVAPSCSLLHLPIDLDLEPKLDPEVRRWLAFAVQRLEEVAVLTRALNDGRAAIADEFAENRAARAERAQSAKVHDPAVRRRTAQATGPSLEQRSSPFGVRKAEQARRHQLPSLPTTTIGSFPQTAEVRSLRAQHRRGKLDTVSYESSLRSFIGDAVRRQEDIGLDVLVHGEFERNDMVEYFGEHLAGFTTTGNGWVQSYGSRCVKPPIIYGDISRPEPITVEWIRYAQSLTERPVKGMLTGPVTILQWSFVRDDQPRRETCRQIALAIRDEVADLEAAGAQIIQIDEPALREGLPLHAEDRPDYLAWAVAAFRLASSGVTDQTQIHTHMCYGQFDDIIDSIVAFDADVISIEAARSDMELLDSFTKTDYPNDIGPGLWDIHSPRVPTTDELAALLTRAAEVFPAERLWVNPDCGLKTRSWAEVEPALRNLVEAAHRARAGVGRAGDGGPLHARVPPQMNT